MARRMAYLAVAMLLAACGGSSTPAPLGCRLPVTWPIPDTQPTAYHAGFLSVPAGTLAEDASAPPGSQSYDAALSRWLPVPVTAVAPDGLRYAYPTGNAYLGTAGTLHVVDVATGADTVVYSGSPVFSVVRFAAEGIYITEASPEGFPRGLWLQDPAGGAPRLISAGIVAPAVGAGSAWGLEFNPADPSPGPGGMEGPMNQVLRLDLAGGGAAAWFYRPGSSVYVLGFDPGGRPLVSAVLAAAQDDPSGRARYEIWAVESAGQASLVYSGSGVQLPLRLVVVDRHGAWFDSALASSTESQVWLYRGGAVEKVATVGVGDLAIAGACLP